MTKEFSEQRKIFRQQNTKTFKYLKILNVHKFKNINTNERNIQGKCS